MEKILNLSLIFILIFLVSCEKDVVIKSIELDSITSTCSLYDDEPVSGAINPHGRYTSLSGPPTCYYQSSNYCLPIEIWSSMGIEIWHQETFPGARPSGNTLYTNIGTEYIYFTDIIGSVYAFPTITEAQANLIYTEMACEILDELDSLPDLPSNQAYSINFTYIEIDFDLCCGPTSTFIAYSYNVYVNTLP